MKIFVQYSYPLTVQVEINESKLRIINAYGTQDSSDGFSKESLNFWQDLEEEIMRAHDEQTMILVQLDANAKLGPKIIKNDPHIMLKNCKLLLDVIQR